MLTAKRACVAAILLVAALLLVAAGPDQKFWPTIVIGTAAFAFMAFAFNPVRWAAVAVPGFALSLLGLNYFRVHPTEPAGLAALAATIVGGSIYVWVNTRKRRATDVRDLRRFGSSDAARRTRQ